MVSDLNNSIVIESTKDGLNIYDNEIGVLTNNPPFINQQTETREIKDYEKGFKKAYSCTE